MLWRGLWKPNRLYRTLSRMGLAVSYRIQPAFAKATASSLRQGSSLPAEALTEAGAGDGDRTRDVQLGKTHLN